MKRRKRGGKRDMTDREDRVEGPVSASGVRHIPVLLHEVLSTMAPKPGERYIDATFGAGGYSRAILDAADCEVLGLDRDPLAIEAGRALAAQFGSQSGQLALPSETRSKSDDDPDGLLKTRTGKSPSLSPVNKEGPHSKMAGSASSSRLTLVQTPFSELEAASASIGWPKVDGIVFDLGVSSMQIDEAERGFSFMRDGPLDMRMSREGLSAADVVNTYDEAEIANILYTLGEERRSRSIAAAIVKDRVETPFTGTAQLAGLIARVLGRGRDEAKHPATRSFQALRLYINDELGELERALGASERLLKTGGRLVVVSFHSLEDRIVKQFLALHSGKRPAASRFLPPKAEAEAKATFELIHRHGLVPSDDETAANPRARSARLRAALRI